MSTPDQPPTYVAQPVSPDVAQQTAPQPPQEASQPVPAPQPTPTIGTAPSAPVEPESPPPNSVGNDDAGDFDARVAQIVEAKLSEAEAKHAKQIEALQRQLANANAPIDTTLPEHVAGPGMEAAQSWGQWHQELARAGQLTKTALAHVMGTEPPEDGS